MNDPQLSRLSSVLLLLAAVSAVVSFVTPLVGLFGGGPIILMHDSETWTTTLYHLPAWVAVLCVAVIVSPSVAWAYCMVQIAHLAHHFKIGVIFERRNAFRFIRIGYGLGVMGILSNLLLPILATVLYVSHTAPWQADVSWFDILDPSLIVAGIFFYVLGQIMLRGVELQETNRLTI